MNTEHLFNHGFNRSAAFLRSVIGSRLWFLPYSIILIGLVAFGWFKPNVGWDVLGYTGSALTFAGEEQIHDKSYELVKQALPQEYEALTTDDLTEDRISTYRSTMKVDESAFHEQLAYYMIRPVFVGALALVYKAGFNPVDAMILISVFSSFGMGILVYRRLVKDIKPFLAVCFAVSLMLCFRLPSYAGTTTVDPLLAFVFVAFVFQFEKGINFAQVLSFCLLLILIRSNAVVFTFPILLMGMLAKPFKLPMTQLTWVQGAVIAVASLLLMKVIEGFVGNYGWWTVFYFTFIKSLHHPTQFHEVFHPQSYFSVLLAEGRWLLSDNFATTFYIFISMMLAGLCTGKADPHKVAMSMLVFACIIIFVGHFLLFPAVFIRFFFPVFILSGVYALLVVLPRQTYLYTLDK